MIVVDASVIIKWIKKDEEHADKARLLYTLHRQGKEKIVIPQLLYFEFANYLVTKSRTSKEKIKETLQFLLESELQVHRVKDSELVKAALLAKQYKTSFYDMLYAVVAKKHKTVLVTADKKFVATTKFSYVKLLSEYSAALDSCVII